MSREACVVETAFDTLCGGAHGVFVVRVGFEIVGVLRVYHGIDGRRNAAVNEGVLGGDAGD